MAKKTRAMYEAGLEVEKEHLPTYKWLSDFVRINKKLPEVREFFLHIIDDHFNEFKGNPEDYYPALKELESELKKKS